VLWRAGGQAVVTGAQPGFLYEVEEPGTAARGREPQAAVPAPWFEDASERLGHRHLAETFDDFVRQPLLPYRLSSLGPGAGWFDVDGDGREEMLVAGDRGGSFEPSSAA
jgi:hypothetical protein